MKQLFDELSKECSRFTTRKYSTSFSMGILFLNRRLRSPVYSIYAFVRFADEIVDSFHGFDKESLLKNFRTETFTAIENKISLNPVLNSFQEVVHKYDIELNLIETFLDSMEMDLNKMNYNRVLFEKYILGSAEVVGLMCLKVFCEGDSKLYNKLKHPAMKLGSAFQKVNFLRDIKADSEILGRHYFPGLDLINFSADEKKRIEKDIEEDFHEALKGILKLPASSRSGVFLAYYYYTMLFKKIKRLPAHRIMKERIRIPNYEKLFMMVRSNLKLHLHLM